MEWKQEKHRIYVENEAGELLAEITFPLVEAGVVDINHTFVAEVLRGQGMAGKLMNAAVEAIRENGWKARTSCSYAEGWKGKHPEAFVSIFDFTDSAGKFADCVNRKEKT